MCSPAFLLAAGLLHSSGSSQQATRESGEVEPLDGTWCLAVVSDKTKSDSEEQGDKSQFIQPHPSSSPLDREGN